MGDWKVDVVRFLEIKGMTPREFRRHAGTRFGR